MDLIAAAEMDELPDDPATAFVQLERISALESGTGTVTGVEDAIIKLPRP